MCACDRDICRGDAEGSGGIKGVGGVDGMRDRAGRGDMKKMFLRVIPEEREHVCLFNIGVGRR